MAAHYDDFEGKVVVVAGGALGIGQACATAFAEQKAKVVVVDVNAEAGKALEETVRAKGGWLRYVTADATDPEALSRVAEGIRQEGELAALVNCVGGWRVSKPGLDVPAKEWEAGLRLNLNATFYACQAFGRRMVEQGSGAIVNVSSTASKIAAVAAPIWYGAAKAGVDALTRQLAAELGPHGVRVNAINPGTTRSERIMDIYSDDTREAIRQSTTRGRLAEPEEIASAVLFLASNEAIHVTGVTMIVAGGQTIIG